MQAPAVHIDRLELDLRGIPAPVAREALAGLGPALQQALAAQPVRAGLPARIEHLEAGALPLAPGASAAALRDALAARLAHALAQRSAPAETL